MRAAISHQPSAISRLTRATLIIALAALTAARAEAQGAFRAMWGSSPTDIWAVGDNGMAAHFIGSGWVAMRTGADKTLRAVWAAGPRDVWAVGDEGTIMHLTAEGWNFVPAPVRRDLVAVGGCGANDVWIVAQSDDQSRPPRLFHYNGSTWTNERSPVSFRAAGLQLTCQAGGGGGITIVGATFWDPRPTERKEAGVMLRRTGDSWTVTGADGRAINDPQIGGAAWTSAAMCGTHRLLSGRGERGAVILKSSGGTWSPVPVPAPRDADESSFRFSIGCDGTPLFVFDKGFGRLVNGQWAIQTGGDDRGSSEAAMEGNAARMQAMMQRMQAYQARGQQPPRALTDSFQMVMQGMSQASSNMMSGVMRQQLFAFGDQTAVWPAAGNTFYIASDKIRRVTGDSIEVVWNGSCILTMQAEACQEHAARERAPSAAPGPAPVAPEDTDEGEAGAAPAGRTNTPTNRPRLPSLPRIRRP